MSVLHAIALVLAVLGLVPSAILCLECLAAWLPQRRATPVAARAPRIAVLVPAHDEEEQLSAALHSIRPELREGDRLLVVAHNCRDRTAEIARTLGAEVLEARDAGTGGKPDALKAGLRALERDPPAVVVIVDADCRVTKGAIRTLAGAAAARGAPVQGDYRFAANGSSARTPAAPGDTREPDGLSSISSLALLLKNVVRPSGLANLGLPCLLNGAGSAYPFEQLRSAPHGEGSIAEDYQLSIDLALRGHPTRFVPDARIDSVLPARRESALRQRKRWEHGHLMLVFASAPRLLARALVTGRAELLFLGLDLLVPPLAFLALFWLVTTLIALTVALAGAGAAPLLVSGAAGALLLSGVVSGLWRLAGARTALSTLLRVPAYLAWKLPLYLAFLVKRETRWRKTERT